MRKHALYFLVAGLLLNGYAQAAGKPCGNSYIAANLTCHINTPAPYIPSPPVPASTNPDTTPTVGVPAPDVLYFPVEAFKSIGTLTQSGESYTLAFGDQTLTLVPGKNVATLTLKPQSLTRDTERVILMQGSPIVVQGKTYVPLRLLEHLGCTRNPRIFESLATCDGKTLQSTDLLSY